MTSVSGNRSLHRLALATAIATYCLIIMGGIVRVTGSGLGCGLTNDWPLCHGALLPPLQQTAIIEFTHRWIAAIDTALVVALAIAAWWMSRGDSVLRRRIAYPAAVVVLFFVLQIILGALTVELKLPSGVIMVHLANALLLLASLIYLTLATSPPPRPAEDGGKWPLARIAMVATYLLALSGALVVDQGAGYACSAWPLCGNGFALDGNTTAVINLFHRFVAGIVVLFLGYAMAKLRRGLKSEPVIGPWTMVVNFVILAQIIAGALVVELRLPAGIRALHLALATSLWAGVAIVGLRFWLLRKAASEPKTTATHAVIAGHAS